MKKIILCIGCAAGGAAAALLSSHLFFKAEVPQPVPVSAPVQSVPAPAVPQKKYITGYGYIRGRSATTLKNKYGAFVRKVYFYSDAPVKKGDCILEYDDFDLRKKIVAAENSIANLKKDLARQLAQQEVTLLDPLPSDYRHVTLKTRRAKELLDRTEKEYFTYKTLYSCKSVSELDMRSKKQAFEDARASYQIALEDQDKVKKGLRQLKIKQADLDVESCRTKLAGMERELALLKEEQKYYKIVTPYDGIIVTNSDTVHAWDNAGTSAAVIHRVHRGYYIYSYFEEKDIIHIPNGTPGKFYSTDNGKCYDLVSFDVTSSRTAVGEKVYHLVKFKVLSPVGKDITMSGTGVIKIPLPSTTPASV